MQRRKTVKSLKLGNMEVRIAICNDMYKLTETTYQLGKLD